MNFGIIAASGLVVSSGSQRFDNTWWDAVPGRSEWSGTQWDAPAGASDSLIINPTTTGPNANWAVGYRPEFIHLTCSRGFGTASEFLAAALPDVFSTVIEDGVVAEGTYEAVAVLDFSSGDLSQLSLEQSVAQFENSFLDIVFYEDPPLNYFDDTYWNKTGFTWNSSSNFWFYSSVIENASLTPITSGPNANWNDDFRADFITFDIDVAGTGTNSIDMVIVQTDRPNIDRTISFDGNERKNLSIKLDPGETGQFFGISFTKNLGVTARIFNINFMFTD